ncbi:MAG: small ribosomal subunit Rsm22 family protein [Ktedonobacteraceae bacterium]
MDLPDSLRNALSHELETVTTSQRNMTAAATQLSQRYRSRQVASESTFLRLQADVVAYSAYRLPATFAAIYAALQAVQQSRPEWRPRTLFDAGAGPGTAMWAASELWPELEQITLFERDETMIAFGKQLTTHGRSQAVRQATWQKVDLLGRWEIEPNDLVITSYVLGELPALKQEEFLTRLWLSTMDTLVLIEPGTPIGFAHIRRARQQLIRAGGQIIAPCPHNLACPIAENDWCHFAQRISRTQLHRQIKQATLSYEDEKFSYMALSHTKGRPIGGRIIRHPQVRSGHISLELCTPEGLKSATVTRKNKEAFRIARDLKWGDALASNG